MYSHTKQIKTAGAAPAVAKGALILLHGRGGTAANIIGIANELDVDGFALYAPQATNNSWYPLSFLAPDEQNQPALDSALEMVDETVKQALADGIPAHKIYFLGFSQGACLTLEYITRHAQPFGGAVAFTGGLIGEHVNLDNYKGDFIGMPVLITTGNPDPHVPLSRVEESVKVLKSMDAAVTLKVYNGRPHTISREEIDLANNTIFI
ncbi:alpha/beta hydrolase [Mucilaginibacter psychrotolerans]|uniref:Alpha/beta fold hydrolase n=1 Tax=Mucilaginibacter psychrotolerans TaxID=1524096 RepID=A0A4Y8SJS7_9SPHI|nr:dienelactone hydrolase family protein [Mucilaginibacter psychrotolerans]TFF39168.1 alpha/beta fold hydrolase [Mucilaginibacter psychrotolerans]